MSQPDRQNLAHQQAQLLRALLQKSPAPKNINLHHATLTLQNKRRHEAVLCLPETQQSLAETFPTLFEKFAHETPYPTHGGPLKDAANFTHWLKKSHQLPPSASLESLLLQMRFTKLPIKLAKSPHTLLLALRLNKKIKLLPLLRW